MYNMAKKIKAAVFDIHSTLMSHRNEQGYTRFRPGLSEFLYANPELAITFFTDATRSKCERYIIDALRSMNVYYRFEKREPSDGRAECGFYRDSLKDRVKDLALVAAELSITRGEIQASEIVFLGDSIADVIAAIRYKTRIVKFQEEGPMNLSLAKLGNLEDLTGDCNVVLVNENDQDNPFQKGDYELLKGCGNHGQWKS